MSIPLRLPDGDTVEGTHPVVLIGPNGSGKTRFGAQLARQNLVEMIGAVRNLEIQTTLPVQTTEQALNNLRSQKRQRSKRPWTMANEIDHLFSKLIAEDSSSAQKFRDQWTSGSIVEPEETALTRLRHLWSDIMPGRTIDFESYSPKVTSDLAGDEYPAQQMSDGERVALYLAGRILDVENSIVVVDEPEIHFHSRLAVRFWDALERERRDIRFVYITHDLTFARSRKLAQYILVKPEGPTVLDVDANLPPEVAQAILAAASFSVLAQRIVFCEGTEGGVDALFYGRWFEDAATVVVPVGTCDDVRESVRSFGKSKLVEGVEAFGIVDRDYWPSDRIDSLGRDVFVLPVHEVESLYCLEEILRAVGRYLAVNTNELDNKYVEFLNGVRSHFTGGALAKQVSERFKRRMEQNFFGTLNSLSGAADLVETRANLVGGVEISALAEHPGDLFDEEQARVEGALLDPKLMLEILPGKDLIAIAARVLGVTKERYMALVNGAIRPRRLEGTDRLVEDAAAVGGEGIEEQEREETGATGDAKKEHAELSGSVIEALNELLPSWGGTKKGRDA